MKSAPRIALAGLAGLVLAWLAWTAGTSPASGREERTRIAGKTEVERDQLARRLREFRELSAGQRTEILRIHESVLADKSLARTLENYTSFVAGLDPWERERLESETDPQKRLEEIRRLIAMKNGHRSDMRHPGWMTGETVYGTTFRSDDFQDILERLIATIGASTPAGMERGSIEWQFWAVRRLAATADREDSWPPDEITRDILAKIPHDRFRDFLLHSDRIDDDRRRRFLAMLIARSLMAEWQRAIPDRVPKQRIRAALSSLQDRRSRDLGGRNPARLQAEVIAALENDPGSMGEFARNFGDVRELYRQRDPFADGRWHRDRDDHDHDDHDRKRDRDDHDRRKWRADGAGRDRHDRDHSDKDDDDMRHPAPREAPR